MTAASAAARASRISAKNEAFRESERTGALSRIPATGPARDAHRLQTTIARIILDREEAIIRGSAGETRLGAIKAYRTSLESRAMVALWELAGQLRELAISAQETT